MTHNEKRGSAWREAQLGLFTGSIYGATHTITGHPLDTIKSKMQIQTGYNHSSAWEVAKKMYKTDGLISFYRGCIPPLWGSMVYRGIMISSYEYAFTWLEKNTDDSSIVKQDVFLGIRPMVPMASVFSAAVRGCFENPIEYAKVMGQTGQKWQFKDIYRGFPFQIVRTTALLIPIFTSLDVARRKTTWLSTLPGNFAVTALSSAFAFVFCWPLETLKNLAQSGTPHANATLSERLAYLGGPLGLYRGMGPGVLAGAIRNGSGMVAMVYAQAWASQLGLR